MRGELKNAAFLLGLDYMQIAQWHNQLLQSACDVAGNCLKICNDSSVRENVRRLVGDKTICHQLGAPTGGLALNDADKGYEQWLFNFWGRRTSYFLSSLLTGLKRANNNNSHNKNHADLISNLDKHDKLLDDDFNKRRWGILTPQTSLASGGDLANCLVTYLDPILFTSLYVLNRYRANEQFLTEEAVGDLLNLIEEEVCKATAQGTGRNDQVVDESTMWWGFVELVKCKQDKFKLGGHTGWQGVNDVCSNLIRSGGENLRFPKKEETCYESTFEIYGETRTRLLVAKNCIELVYYLHPDWLEKIRSTLYPFVARQLRFVTDPRSDILGHICLMGLGLELSSMTLYPIVKSEKAENQLNERTQDASRVFIGTGRQKFEKNDERFCVWIVEKGQFDCPEKPKILTKSEVETLRNNKNFNVFIDAGRLWIRKDKNSPAQQMSDLGKDDFNIKFLSLLLCYKNKQPDINVLCQKITGLYLEHPPKLACDIGRKFSVRVTRFKKRMRDIFSAVQFDVPLKKITGGYYCCGDISSCVIVPRSKELEFTIPVL